MIEKRRMLLLACATSLITTLSGCDKNGGYNLELDYDDIRNEQELEGYITLKAIDLVYVVEIEDILGNNKLYLTHKADEALGPYNLIGSFDAIVEIEAKPQEKGKITESKISYVSPYGEVKGIYPFSNFLSTFGEIKENYKGNEILDIFDKIKENYNELKKSEMLLKLNRK